MKMCIYKCALGETGVERQKNVKLVLLSSRLNMHN